MSFDIRLIKLMNLFHTTNKELANACNVDPSLVSRWRSGQRLPSDKFDQVSQIASYFLQLDMDIEQRMSIQEVLSLQKLHSPLLERQIDLLASWLSDRRNPIINTSINYEVEQPQNKKLIKLRIHDEKQTNKTKSRPRFPLSSQTKREFHLFQGNSGKRKAALLFLQKALSIDVPTDIYIFSDEILNWWLEDDHFQVQWISYLKLIVLKKHHIHVIHNVNRNKEEFAKHMNVWLPMHLIGSINSHYYPIYVESIVKETFMVIKNNMALESRSTFLTPKENICLIFEDKDTVDMIESIFLGRLVSCKPLVQVYKEQDQAQLLQLYLRTVSAEYNVIFLHNFINSIFLPDSVFERHCEKWVHTKKRDYMQFVKQWKNSQYLMFNKKICLDVFPLDTLEEIATSRKYSHYDPVLFADNSITLTKDEIILTLKAMLYALQRFDSLQIVIHLKKHLSEQPNINIEYRENHSAIFTTNYELITPYIGLYSNEGNLMHAFGYYLNGLLAQIPTSFKRKEETIKQLYGVLKKLES